jgi:HK97 family phage major capsid protein/HK97 family phage prohead protease
VSAVDLHAYTHLDIKAISDDGCVISGIASTPSIDRNGHTLDPMGARFTNPIPLLLHHDQKLPVGSVILTATPDGLAFTAQLPVVTEPGPLKDRIEETKQSLRARLLSKVSVGFRILEGGAERLANGLLRLAKTEICELSLTTMPVNPDAVVLSVKSLAPEWFVAPGMPPALPSKVKPMTTSEQITTFEADRTLRVTALNSLQTEIEGRTKTEAERAKFGQLQLEIKTLDDELTDLRALEAINATKAQPVKTQPSLVTVPSAPVVQMKSNLPPGTSFVRYCKAMAASRGDTMQALGYAEQWRETTPEVELFIKAAVAAGTTTDATWAKPLVPSFQHLASEFIELLRPATILGKIPGLRRVPFNVSVPMQTAGGAYNWVGEGAPKPLTKLAFGTVSLPMYKVAGIIVFTEELARSSSPAAEGVFRSEMIAGIAQFMDAQFIDPAVALVAGVKPASITNGVTGIAATANPLDDIAALLKSFVTAKIPISGVVLLMSESNAFVLSAQRNAMGDPTFPEISTTGGSINGVPVITSEAAGTNIIGLVPRYVLYADDGGVTIDVSREASVQMADTPMNPADATTVYRSFWQDNLVGLRAERFVAWIKSLGASVNMITGTAYVP